MDGLLGAGVRLLAVVLTTTGCANGMLTFATYTKVGVNIAAADGQPTNLSMGYDRYEGALIPVVVDGDGDKPVVLDQAPSVFACFGMYNGWFQGLNLAQSFATGDAADKVAEAPRKPCWREVHP